MYIFIAIEVYGMATIKEKSKRKNITLSPEAEKDLIKLSKILGKPQSKVIETLIKEKTKTLEKGEKIEALHKMKGAFHGLFKEKKIQTIKSEIEND